MRISDWSSDVCSSDLDLLQRLEVALAEHRRAEIAHAFGVEIVEAVDRLVDLAHQAELDPLAHLGALLAGNSQQVIPQIGVERAGNAELKVGASSPALVTRRGPAQYQALWERPR